MALGYLSILLGGLVIIGLILQGLLYRGKKPARPISILNMVFALVLAYLVFTSLPTNYGIQRMVAILIGGLSVLATAIMITKEESTLIAKLFMSVSIIGGLIQLMV